jgi:hypothetical protein
MISLRKLLYISLFTFPLSLINSNVNTQDVSGLAKVEKRICYIENIFTKTGTRFVTIDTIEWFQDEKAVNAYKKDHPESTAPLPNGYYIRNRVVRWDTLAIADTAQFVMQSYSHDSDGNFRHNERIDFDHIARLFSETKQAQYRRIPFWIVISQGRILSIAEQYIP